VSGTKAPVKDDDGIVCGPNQDGRFCNAQRPTSSVSLPLNQGRARYWVASSRQRSLNDPRRTYSRGETRAPASVLASEAKSEFGRVLEMAIQGGAVVITKHDAPKAVLISVENFNAPYQSPSRVVDSTTGSVSVWFRRASSF
jgi:prevent-host-death family protein